MEGSTRWLKKSTSVRMEGIRLRSGFQFANSIGFALRDDEGLVMAADAGPFLAAVQAADVDPVSVATGAPLCQNVIGDIQTTTYYELQFTGATTAVVGLGRDGEFTTATRRYFARNGGANSIVSTALDGESMSPWAIWLRP
jgi:hypothetical protein